jgi:hypothetical protein
MDSSVELTGLVSVFHKARRFRLEGQRSLESRLFQECDERIEGKYSYEYVLSKTTLYIVGDQDPEFIDSVMPLAFQSGKSVFALSETDQRVVESLKNDTSFQCMIWHGPINSRTIDSLVRFREAYPNVVITLVSPDLASDPSSEGRTAICDATLSAPVSTRRLYTAIEAAFQNHHHIRRCLG